MAAVMSQSDRDRALAMTERAMTLDEQAVLRFKRIIGEELKTLGLANDEKYVAIVLALCVAWIAAGHSDDAVRELAKGAGRKAKWLVEQYRKGNN